MLTLRVLCILLCCCREESSHCCERIAWTHWSGSGVPSWVQVQSAPVDPPHALSAAPKEDGSEEGDQGEEGEQRGEQGEPEGQVGRLRGGEERRGGLPEEWAEEERYV